MSKFELATVYSGKHDQWRAIQSSCICLVVLLMGSRHASADPSHGHIRSHKAHAKSCNCGIEMIEAGLASCSQASLKPQHCALPLSSSAQLCPPAAAMPTNLRPTDPSKLHNFLSNLEAVLSQFYQFYIAVVVRVQLSQSQSPWTLQILK